MKFSADLTDIRFGIGPMSKNVVDACIDFSNRGRPLMLIPSRRQVEWSGGYTGWTTHDFCTYVRERTDQILLMRDHGGPHQGDNPKEDMHSLFVDCAHFDAIHLDPWKVATSFEEGAAITPVMLEYCHALNPYLLYEIGTEQAICPYEANQLDAFIAFVERNTTPAQFKQIRWAVVQSGTALHGNENTGQHDPGRLTEMLMVCEKWGLLAKVHNGDYLPRQQMDDLLCFGVDSVNIAPEMGQIETQTYLQAIGPDQNVLDIFHKIVYDSRRWTKWLTAEQATDKVALINAAGHYVLNHPDFVTHIKSRYPIDETIKANVTRRLEELHGLI
jgi:tagatose-1,6-bisphosphate aldolase non-catalytic subunit AgaZ/GatZ